jgi:YesN/AraC family two-component response regulator
VFWTSPFYSGERFAGALLSGGVLVMEKQQAVENIMQNCGDGICREEIEVFLINIPEKNRSEVKALAQMMLMCADQISGIGFSSKTMTSGLDITMTMEFEQRAKIAPITGQAKASARKGRNFAAGSEDYPMDKERMLLASLRRGDNGEARKILKEHLGILHKTTQGNFPVFRLKAMELAVLLSRAVCNSEDIVDDSILETNNRYLKKIEEGNTLQEITEILTVIVERMSGKIFSFQGVRHSSALRKAERFIWENYTRKISLQEIAGASGLSAPYFSTIFKEEMGENLSNYLNRLRVEKAAAMLAETDLHISGIAAACGFEDQSWFSKIFKSYTGHSPGKFREKGGVLN